MKGFSTLSPSVKMKNVWCLTFKPLTFLLFVVTEFRENFSSSYFTFSIIFLSIYRLALSGGHVGRWKVRFIKQAKTVKYFEVTKPA
jgi:hypothetical protein